MQLNTLHSRLSTLHFLLSTLYSLLCVLYPVFFTLRSLLCTLLCPPLSSSFLHCPPLSPLLSSFFLLLVLPPLSSPLLSPVSSLFCRLHFLLSPLLSSFLFPLSCPLSCGSWACPGQLVLGMVFGSHFGAPCGLDLTSQTPVIGFFWLASVGRHVALDVARQAKISRQRIACFSSHGFWLSVKFTVFGRCCWQF